MAFDEWMRKFHPEKPFERYADDVVVHCKTEKQAQFMLRQIRQRMKACHLELHPVKTKIVNLRGWSETKYPRKYDFLGFTIRASMQIIKGRGMLLPGTFVSIKSRTSMLGKFRELAIHKWRKPLVEVTKGLNPVNRGLLNYYHGLRGETPDPEGFRDGTGYPRGLESTQASLAEMGQMGEGAVQNGGGQMA